MKKVLVDTSVLIAAMVESHPAHQRALPWLQRAREGQFEISIATHTLAELYAVLTRLPLSPRIGPATARRLIRTNVEDVAAIVVLTEEDYREVLSNMSELGLSGGTVYDALAVQAAKKSEADCLLTLNESDFRRVWPEASGRIVSP
jgi:predicted nucleic acid-binding protein